TSSGKLPIPKSPYTAAASYLVNFANSAVKKDIDAQNEDDKAVSGTLQFNFSPTGDCSGDFEKTGIKAIVYSDGDSTAAGYVDVGRINEYCFQAELVPS